MRSGKLPPDGFSRARGPLDRSSEDRVRQTQPVQEMAAEDIFALAVEEVGSCPVHFSRSSPYESRTLEAVI